VRALNYLELAGPLERSGIATAHRQQREALAGRDVEVLTTPWTGGDPLRAAASRATGGRLVRDADLAHLHLFGPGSVAVLRAARREETPVVAHVHTLAENTAGSWRGVEHVTGPLRRYLRWFYAQADLLLCPTQYAADLVRDYPVGTPTEVLTGGVDVAALDGHEALREEYRERHDLDGLVVFAVGNVFERKGLTTFCELAEATDHEFAWFGPYDTGPLASRAVRRWTGDPPENVTFTGWVDDVRGAYGAGDVFCFPAKEETQGLVVLEAMACGKPVVLRDIPVFREQFEDGHDCLLCSDQREFRDALDRLAADPDLRERLGANARETAAAHALPEMGERLADIYRDLASDT
jgi:glycosyltransferase involved in cell wall biosynthesis